MSKIYPKFLFFKTLLNLSFTIKVLMSFLMSLRQIHLIFFFLQTNTRPLEWQTEGAMSREGTDCAPSPSGATSTRGGTGRGSCSLQHTRVRHTSSIHQTWEIRNSFILFHPGTYPKNIRCGYKFIGEPGQRIRLEFRDFDLFYGGAQ